MLIKYQVWYLLLCSFNHLAFLLHNTAHHKSRLKCRTACAHTQNTSLSIPCHKLSLSVAGSGEKVGKDMSCQMQKPLGHSCLPTMHRSASVLIVFYFKPETANSHRRKARIRAKILYMPSNAHKLTAH